MHQIIILKDFTWLATWQIKIQKIAAAHLRLQPNRCCHNSVLVAERANQPIPYTHACCHHAPPVAQRSAVFSTYSLTVGRSTFTVRFSVCSSRTAPRFAVRQQAPSSCVHVRQRVAGSTPESASPKCFGKKAQLQCNQNNSSAPAQKSVRLYVYNDG